MNLEFDFSKVKTSWTKFDIVQVMDVIHDKETLFKYKNKEAKINEPILRSFLGMKSLEEKLPSYWLDILDYPKEQYLFALFSIIFTHGEIVKLFAEKYSTGNMKGVFLLEKGKQYTNLRSALIESGASQPFLRRSNEVPYDFSPIFQNLEVGKLFKKVLEERISRITKSIPSKTLFYKISFENNFHKALSLSKGRFQSWLEGKKHIENNYINGVLIRNFFSIREVNLSQINGAKEVYFLGENGDGKSLILMAIYLAFNRFYIVDKTDKKDTGKVLDLLESNRKSEMELIGFDDKEKEFGSINVGYLNNFFAYGTHRGRYSTDHAEKYGFMSLFGSDEELTNPETWLISQKHLELEKKGDKNTINGEKKDVLDSLSVIFLEKMFYELLEKNVSVQVSAQEVTFKEKGAILSFDQLSEGYKSILIFISDLLFRLQKNQPKVKVIEDFYGIVIVDEIDLHLHPKWKRALIKKLRSLLPNIQFIFTTHSPTIIQGASDDAIIYRVYRNAENGDTSVSDPYYRSNLNHWMINTLITSPLFGLEDSRLDPNNENSNTDDTYLLYRINSKLVEELNRQKMNGKEFITDSDIDKLIEDILQKEIGEND